MKHFQYAFAPTGQRFMKEDVLNGSRKLRMYDGNDVVADYAQSSSNGLSLQRTYANGLSVDQKIARFDSSGNARFHLRDRLNSTSVIIGNDGAVLNHYTSNSWGASLNRFENVQNRYTFTGREEDGESGFMHFRARSYFPTIGRFQQRDPKDRFGAHYVYTSNNPISRVDPLGLEPTQAQILNGLEELTNGGGHSTLGRILLKPENRFGGMGFPNKKIKQRKERIVNAIQNVNSSAANTVLRTLGENVGFGLMEISVSQGSRFIKSTVGKVLAKTFESLFALGKGDSLVDVGIGLISDRIGSIVADRLEKDSSGRGIGKLTEKANVHIKGNPKALSKAIFESFFDKALREEVINFARKEAASKVTNKTLSGIKNQIKESFKGDTTKIVRERGKLHNRNPVDFLGPVTDFLQKDIKFKTGIRLMFNRKTNSVLGIIDEEKVRIFLFYKVDEGGMAQEGTVRAASVLKKE